MVRSGLVAVLMAFVAAFGPNARAASPPEVAFTQIAECSSGGSDTRGSLSGVVINVAQPQAYRIVLYAFAGDSWWVQPVANNPHTQIQPNGVWSNWTHLGNQYAALLVRRDYAPSARTQALPEVGGPVLALASAPCRGP